MIYNLFLWIYCLPIPLLILLLSLATAALLAVHQHLRTYRWWNAGLVILLLCSSFLIVWQTVLSRSPGNFQPPNNVLFHSYLQVLRGANPELLRSNFMNILLFFPLGLCAGLLLSHWNAPGWKLLLISICLCGFSCVIEYLQIHYGLGLGEADDVLHNTLGAFLGALIAIEYPIIVRRFSSRIPR